jgi:hypothetical protein
VSAVFAGAICANASEVVQIMAAAAMAANVLDIMTDTFLLGCSHASFSNNNSGNSNLFPRAGEPNRRRWQNAIAP